MKIPTQLRHLPDGWTATQLNIVDRSDSNLRAYTISIAHQHIHVYFYIHGSCTWPLFTCISTFAGLVLDHHYQNSHSTVSKLHDFAHSGWIKSRCFLCNVCRHVGVTQYCLSTKPWLSHVDSCIKFTSIHVNLRRLAAIFNHVCGPHSKIPTLKVLLLELRYIIVAYHKQQNFPQKTYSPCFSFNISDYHLSLHKKFR